MAASGARKKGTEAAAVTSAGNATVGGEGSGMGKEATNADARASRPDIAVTSFSSASPASGVNDDSDQGQRGSDAPCCSSVDAAYCCTRDCCAGRNWEYLREGVRRQ